MNGTKIRELPIILNTTWIFLDAERFQWESAIETIDDRADYREERWIALGNIDNRLHVLIYALRGKNIRLISLRRANSRERRYYEEKT